MFKRLPTKEITFTKNDAWSKDEDTKLAQAASKYKGNWNKIAKAVNSTKAVAECKRRVQKL